MSITYKNNLPLLRCTLPPLTTNNARYPESNPTVPATMWTTYKSRI
jgi:hypothetical protein